LEDEVDIMESDDAKRSSRRGHNGKHEENRAMMSRGRERAVQAAKMLKPVHDHLSPISYTRSTSFGEPS
jgi:hypothetical protein